MIDTLIVVALVGSAILILGRSLMRTYTGKADACNPDTCECSASCATRTGSGNEGEEGCR